MGHVTIKLSKEELVSLCQEVFYSHPDEENLHTIFEATLRAFANDGELYMSFSNYVNDIPALSISDINVALDKLNLHDETLLALCFARNVLRNYEKGRHILTIHSDDEEKRIYEKSIEVIKY